MRKELDDLLCERYPDIFIDRYADKTVTGMCWGFCCADGWFELIDSLCAAISSHVRAGASLSVVARQVEEKFGRLRFHIRGADDEIRRLVWLTEDLSEMTCETCGRSGATYIGVSQGALCPECFATVNTTIP